MKKDVEQFIRLVDEQMKGVYKNIDLKAHTFFLMIALVYKLALEMGFWYLLQNAYKDLNVYRFEFSIAKFIYGLLWIFILFALLVSCLVQELVHMNYMELKLCMEVQDK